MRRVLLVVTLGLAAIAARQPHPTEGQSSNPQSLPPLSLGNAIVAGRVMEGGTSRGVPGAVVTLASPALGTASARFAEGTPGGPRRLLADAQGRFAFRDLPAGSYTLTSVASGYVDAGQTRPTPLTRSLTLTPTLDLSDTDRPATVTIAMWKLGGISGTVRDQQGEPMVGVPMSVFPHMAGRVVMQRAASSMSDDRGAYHADVVPGRYVVAVLAATTTTPAAVPDAFQRALADGVSIAAPGRGVGTRLGGVLVNQWSSDYTAAVPPIFGYGVTPMIYPTTFHPSAPSAAGASTVSVGSGEEKAGIDLELRPIAIRRVSGRVTSGGGPVANVAIRLVSAEPGIVRTGSTALADASQAVTDGAGHFTLIGVTPGSHWWCVFRSPDSASDSLLWNADAVTIADTDLTDLLLTLQPGSAIGGRVAIDPSAGARLTPDAMRAIAITPRSMRGCPAAVPRSTSASRPDEAGRFVTQPTVPGPYLMSVTGLPAGWVVQSVMTGGIDAADRPFELSAAGVDDMVVTITDRISELSGTVRESTGQISRSAAVAVFPTDKALWPTPGLVSRRAQIAAPGRDGRYAIRGLPTGEYFVVAVGGAHADVADPESLASLAAAAMPVTLVAGQRRTLDLAVAIVRAP